MLFSNGEWRASRIRVTAVRRPLVRWDSDHSDRGRRTLQLSVVVSMWDCRGRSVVRMISSATNLILSLLSLGQSNILKYKETLKLIRKIFDINHLENVDNVDYSKEAWQWLPLNLFYRLSRQDVLRLVTFCHTLGGWYAGNHRDYSD